MLPISVLRKLKRINPYVYPLLDKETIFKIKNLSAEIVIDLFEKHFSVSIDVIRSKCRVRRIVYLRRILVDALMNRSQINTVEAGRIINKDHSSIIYLRDSTEVLLQYDDFKKLYVGFNKKLDEYESQQPVL